MVDDYGTATYLLDIARIMRGQKDRDALLRVQLSYQIADTLLGDDIQANGRLVQEDDGGPAERSRVLNVFANLSTSMIGIYLSSLQRNNTCDDPSLFLSSPAHNEV